MGTVNNRKHFFKEDFFENIDTKEKAYFLGWFYSDENNYTPSWSSSIKIQEEDGYILEKLSCIISDCTVPIKNSFRNIGKNQKYITLSSKKLSGDLYNKGVVDNKSLILKFPSEDQVPNYLHSHFIRGYFDGDGCINSYTRKNRTWPDYHFTLTGTHHFLTGCQDIIKQDIGITVNKLVPAKKVFNMSYGGTNNCLKIREFIYKDCDSLFLTRKYNKFQEIREFTKEIEIPKVCLLCECMEKAKGLCKKHYNLYWYYKNTYNMKIDEFNKLYT